jgi:hypothetical protein
MLSEDDKEGVEGGKDVSNDSSASSATDAGGVEPAPPKTVDYSNQVRNVAFLAVAWCFSLSAVFMQISTTTVAAGELVGAAASTVPVGSMLLTSAAMSLKLVALQCRFTPRTVYIVSGASAIAGAALQILAVSTDASPGGAFAALVIGSALVGPVPACGLALRCTSI